MRTANKQPVNDTPTLEQQQSVGHLTAEHAATLKTLLNAAWDAGLDAKITDGSLWLESMLACQPGEGNEVIVHADDSTPPSLKGMDGLALQVDNPEECAAFFEALAEHLNRHRDPNGVIALSDLFEEAPSSSTASMDPQPR